MACHRDVKGRSLEAEERGRQGRFTDTAQRGNLGHESYNLTMVREGEGGEEVELLYSKT